jgi:hypothetical protein
MQSREKRKNRQTVMTNRVSLKPQEEVSSFDTLTQIRQKFRQRKPVDDELPSLHEDPSLDHVLRKPFGAI